MIPALDCGQATQLHRAMVEDLLDRVADGASHDVHLFFAPADAGDSLRAWLGDLWRLHPQDGADLGERMEAAFRWAFSGGYDAVTVVGSDIPELSSEIIEETFRALAGYDVVLGPAADGGYYLIGLRRPCPELFMGIAWGTASVLAQTRHRIDDMGLSLLQLGQLRDMDTFVDLTGLSRRFLRDPSLAVSSPRTCRLLLNLSP